MAGAPAPMIEAAAYAAGSMVPSSSPGFRNVRDAILAWWAAEHGYNWPPNVLNNPGFMRPPGQEGYARGTGTVAGAPGVFLDFTDAGHGVEAFIDRVRTSGHYGGIRAAIAAVATGSQPAQAIAAAVGASPWGTNAITMRGALAYIQRTVSAATPTGTGWRTYGGGHPGGGDPGQPVSTSPSGETAASYLGIPGATIWTLALARTLADRFAAESHEKADDVFVFYSDFVGKRADAIPGPHDEYNATTYGGAPRSPDPVAFAVNAAGDIARQFVVLAGLVVLVLMGLYFVVKSEGAAAPA